MPNAPTRKSCRITVVPDPDKDIWHVRLTMDDVCTMSLGLQHNAKLTDADGRALFHALCGEIASWLF